MFNKDVSDEMPMMTFDSPIGISVYLVIQMLLGYFYRDFNKYKTKIKRLLKEWQLFFRS